VFVVAGLFAGDFALVESPLYPFLASAAEVPPPAPKISDVLAEVMTAAETDKANIEAKAPAEG
jgi:hypothetical protein